MVRDIKHAGGAKSAQTVSTAGPKSNIATNANNIHVTVNVPKPQPRRRRIPKPAEEKEEEEEAPPVLVDNRHSLAAVPNHGFSYFGNQTPIPSPWPAAPHPLLPVVQTAQQHAATAMHAQVQMDLSHLRTPWPPWAYTQEDESRSRERSPLHSAGGSIQAGPVPVGDRWRMDDDKQTSGGAGSYQRRSPTVDTTATPAGTAEPKPPARPAHTVSPVPLARSPLQQLQDRFHDLERPDNGPSERG